MIQPVKSLGTGLANTDLFDICIVIGIMLGALIIGVARSPLFREQLFSNSILGFAEATRLFALMIGFLLLNIVEVD